jgi:hypothetical protein
VTSLLGVALVFGSLIALAGCGGGSPGGETAAGTPSSGPATPEGTPSGTSPGTPDTAVRVTSTAFRDGEPIPRRYSCKGDNIPPPLAWTGVPAGATELALVVDDPDAVGGRYVHWVVTGIDPTASGSPQGGTPPGGTVGPNSGGDRRFLGPCPPAGTGVHHYGFTVYVLGTHLDIDPGIPADRASDMIAGTATTQGRLVGTYRG